MSKVLNVVSTFYEAFDSQLYVLEVAKDFINYNTEIKGDIFSVSEDFIVPGFPPELCKYFLFHQAFNTNWVYHYEKNNTKDFKQLLVNPINYILPMSLWFIN